MTSTDHSDPFVGERFVLTRDVHRSPHFIARSGTKGTVVDVSFGAISLRLDDPLPGAEEWDNEVVWSDDDDAPNFWADVALLPGEAAGDEH
jgi:hypothetical protein